MGDSFIIDESAKKLKEKINDFLLNDYSESQLKSKYQLGKNYAKWIIENKRDIEKIALKPIKISYRPFDDRYTIFDNKLVWRWREETMKHFVQKDNIGIDLCRQLVSKDYSHILVTNKITDDSFVSNKSRERGYVFPLYLYPDKTEQKKLGADTIGLFDDNAAPPLRKPNLDDAIIQKISYGLGLDFVPEKTEGDKSTFAPIDLLGYIYAVLHSPAYREKYKEFLKIDFPRVPYPTDKSTFWQLAELGGKLRQIHLLESPVVDKLITQYPQSGDNVVTKPKFTKRDGKSVGDVYINDTQYFANVPEVAWNFYIGGYQPAQKWLKDRTDRPLCFEDILHYQKVIVSLWETEKLIQEIDEIRVE